jgi:FecR protein
MHARTPSLLLNAASLCVAATLSADPPDRVARLSYVDGSVSFQPAGMEEWVPATHNYPLTTGDHLWTDRNSRAELRTDFGALRLGSQTEVSFLNLDDRTAQIRLAQGSLNVGVRELGEDEEIEVATPNGAVTLLRPGEYRVDVNPDGEETTVTVRRGEAEFTASGSAVPIRSQESMIVSGLDEPNYDVLEASPRDSWEDWCDRRDRALERSVATRYVSPATIGYEDLDTYGQWREEAGYGPVWVPTGVVVGWAPYHYGHWAFVAPWGWTWIDDAPWGFAPFHYGRWAHVGGSWAWVPGTIVVRPVYAPALVAWVGGSNWHASLSLGGGGVAWFPLGPREVYVPPYPVSQTYVRQVNITHVNVTNINITNINTVNTRYVNQGVPGGVTAVSRETFVAARPVAVSAVAVPPQALAAAPVLARPANVQPQRESVLARPVLASAVAQPPARVANRPVAAHRTPPPPPVPPLSAAGGTTAPATHPLVRTVSPHAGEGAPPGLRPGRAGVRPPQPVARPLSPVAPPGRLEAPGTSGRPHGRDAEQEGSAPPRSHATEPTGARPSAHPAASDAPPPPPRARATGREEAPTPHEGAAHPEAARPPRAESAPHGGGKEEASPHHEGTAHPETGRPPRAEAAPHGGGPPPKPAATPAPRKEEKKHEEKKDKEKEK